MKLILKIKNYFAKAVKELILESNVVSSKALVGKNTRLKAVFISQGAVVGTNCVIRQSELRGAIKIGNHTTIWGPNTILTAEINKIIIGNYCSIARNVSIQEANHNIKRFTTYFVNRNILQMPKSDLDTVSKGDIIIGNDVWIGSGVVITSGVKIGHGAVIGANSVVTKDIPQFAIAAGVPCKVIKYRFEPEIQEKIIKSKWWELSGDRLKERIEELDKMVADEHAR